MNRPVRESAGYFYVIMMKKVIDDLKKSLLFSFYFACQFLIASCGDDYDDSFLVSRVDNLESRVQKLEELCKQMNTNISSLQVLVAVLQNNDYITGVIPVKQGDEILGYTISFSRSEPIVIFHGEDGSDGKDGVDGQDAVLPLIGIKQDVDGVFYWTLNGEWLKDEKGSKIQAQGINGIDGENGNDGQDGKDAVTPKLKIENNYWYVSYDEENSWKQLGKAIGEKGDNMFKEIKVAEDHVSFILNDKTTFKVPTYVTSHFSVKLKKGGTLGDLLTDEYKRELLSLKISGELNNEDLKTINLRMRSLEELDLSDVLWNVDKNGSLNLNPFGINICNKTIRTVVLPNECREQLPVEIQGWVSLENVVISSDSTILHKIGGDYSLDTIGFAENVSMIYYSELSNFVNVVLPATMKEVYYDAFRWEYYVSGSINHQAYSLIDTVICKSIVPPMIGEWNNVVINQKTTYMFKEINNAWTSDKEKKKLSECTLIVPQESLELYKQANGWKEFGNIKSLD